MQDVSKSHREANERETNVTRTRKGFSCFKENTYRVKKIARSHGKKNFCRLETFRKENWGKI